MQIANAYVAIGGDIGNTVPKYGVTPAEVVLLQAIHGEGAVHEIEPAGEVERTNRMELDRLRANYRNAKDEDGRLILESVYPGASARLPLALEELNLPSVLYKAIARTSATKAPSAKAEALAATTPKAIETDEDGLAEVGADPEFTAPEPEAPKPTRRSRQQAAPPTFE